MAELLDRQRRRPPPSPPPRLDDGDRRARPPPRARRLAAARARSGPRTTARWRSSRATRSCARRSSALVDVAPACADPAELAEHLGAFLARSSGRHPRWRRVARRGRARCALGGRPGGGRGRPRHGEPLHRRRDAGRARRPRCARLWERGAAVSVDLLGEATVTPAEGRALRRRAATRRSRSSRRRRALAGAPAAGGATRSARCRA